MVGSCCTLANEGLVSDMRERLRGSLIPSMKARAGALVEVVIFRTSWRRSDEKGGIHKRMIPAMGDPESIPEIVSSILPSLPPYP
jgi:hypothetical protein